MYPGMGFQNMEPFWIYVLFMNWSRPGIRDKYTEVYSNIYNQLQSDASQWKYYECKWNYWKLEWL